MKVLQNIKSELIVALDIETVRIAENFEDLSEGFKSAWEYKNKQDGNIPSNEELSLLWKRTSSLYAEFSKICAVSLAYLNPQGKLVCKEYYGDNEKELLASLSITLNNMQTHNSQYRLVGHASKYFDYPFTSKRYIINELDIPLCLDSTNLKPWEGMNLCTNDLWKCGGTGAGSSLQALCNVLGVPISKIDLVGDEVGSAFYRGEFERIGRYCSLDSIATFNVFRKYKKESIFQFNEVDYITAYSEKETVKEDVIELPLLQKIYKAVNIDEPTKKNLTNTLLKKKLLEKDKVIVCDILTSLYINNTMFSSDKKDVKQRKREEITQILSNVK